MDELDNSDMEAAQVGLALILLFPCVPTCVPAPCPHWGSLSATRPGWSCEHLHMCMELAIVSSKAALIGCAEVCMLA